MEEILNRLMRELNILIDAKTAEEALYGLIAFLHNGLLIVNEALLRFGNKT